MSASVAIGTTVFDAPKGALDSASVPAADAPATGSLPCSQGRVGEGCEPLAANASQQRSAHEGSGAGAPSQPPPNPQPSGESPTAFGGTRADGAQAVPPHPLQAVGGAKSAASNTHTATIAHPAKATTFTKPADGPGVGGAVFALILVVSLILALGWLAKRMPGFGRATAPSNALRVVGSLSLGPRDRVVVVDVGGTQLLLGVGQNGMTTLHTLTHPLPVAQPSQGTSSLQDLATPFAQLLQKHLGKKP